MEQPTTSVRTPLSLQRRVDEACLHFEDQWQAGGRPDLEALLANFSPPERGAALAELLPLEWHYRHQRGDTNYTDEYVRRFSTWSGVVDQARQRWIERQAQATVGPAAATGEASAGQHSQAAPALAICGYQQVNLLGRGGMGEVFKAFDPNLKRWVALKRLRLDHGSADQRARFRIEAEALARLAHPHIVQVYGYTESDGQPVLEMEYVSGGTLEERLGQGPLPPTVAARLVAILAWAVHAAHEKGIVHRDLKPANVLLGPPVAGNPDNVLGRFPKVSDFGLAALSDTDQHQTQSGLVLGTPVYMSPEQAAGKTRQIGPATDVWALGVTLYRCLSGALPFQGDSVLDTLERIRLMQMRPLREACPAVPPELEELCLACLRYQPADRPTAEQLARQLQSLTGPREMTTEEFRPVRRRRRRGRAVAASLLAAGVVLIAGLWWSAEKPRNQAATLRTAPEPVPTVKLRVMHFQHEEGRDVERGAIGLQSDETRFGDRVVIKAELSRPASCFLVACNFNGKEQLLWPCDLQRPGCPGDPNQPPPLVDQLQYPPPPGTRPHGKASNPHGFALDDDRAGGMQAFVVVASGHPLPSYAQWAARRGPMPWQRLPAAKAVWWSDGQSQEPLTLGGERVRGHVVELQGQPPLLQLCGWAKGPEVDAVEALMFPVFGPGDK
jgi:serine/threonine protein kinase